MIHHLSHDYFVSHQSYPDHPPPALPSRKSLRDRWGRSEVGPGISSKSIYAVRAKSGSQICYQPRRPGTKKRCKFGKWEFFSMLFHFLKKVQWHWWLSYRITTSIWLWLSYVPWCPSQTSHSISNQILDDSIHLCRECFGFNSWRGEYSSIADARWRGTTILAGSWRSFRWSRHFVIGWHWGRRPLGPVDKTPALREMEKNW